LLRYLGIGLVPLIIILWIVPVIHFKKYGRIPEGGAYYESDTLVTEGIFSLLRNPQYLSYVLVNILFALVSQHAVIIGLALGAIFFFYRQARAEEQFLASRYGKEYTVYCERVPRFNMVTGAVRLFSERRKS